MSDIPIDCQEHGPSTKALLCQHLHRDGRQKACGLIEPLVDEEDEELPHAWCSDCQAVLGAENGWTEAAEQSASMTAACLRCLEVVREAQLAFDSEQVFIARDQQDDASIERADAFIQFANKLAEHSSIAESSQSLLIAASRFNAYDALTTADDISADRQALIDEYCEAYRQSFIQNLDDYINHADVYFAEPDQSE